MDVYSYRIAICNTKGGKNEMIRVIAWLFCGNKVCEAEELEELKINFSHEANRWLNKYILPRFNLLKMVEKWGFGQNQMVWDTIKWDSDIVPFFFPGKKNN